MKIFRNVVTEINQILNSIFLFEVFLNTVIVFLAVYLALFLISTNPFYSFIPSSIYFVTFIFLKFKENKVRKVEAKYKVLDEKLRTAADNLYLQNPVVEELQKEVIHEIRRVEASSFLNMRKVSSKIVASVVLCFMILLLTSVNIQPVHIDSFMRSAVNSFGKATKNETPNLFSGGPGGAGDVPAEGEIYGIPSWVTLSQREEEIAIDASGFEVSVRDVKEAQKQTFEEQFPNEVFAQGASAYEENIPKEQQELVKSYFEKLVGG